MENAKHWIRRLKRLNKNKIEYHLRILLFNVFMTKKKYYNLRKFASISPIKKIYDSDLVSVNDHNQNETINFDVPAVKLFSLNNCIVFSNSDFIIQGNEVYWEKIESKHNNKDIIFVDNNLVKYNKTKVLIRVPKALKSIDTGFSLCGVHSNVWSHFLIQYLPKLIIASKLNIEVNLIIPDYTDYNINQILEKYLLEFNNLSLVRVKSTEAIKVRQLYFVNNIGFVAEHSYQPLFPNVLVPSYVAGCIRETFFRNEDEIKIDANNKLFLRRTGIRNLINYSEIEAYFENKGYKLVDSSNLSITEKRTLFGSASVIVGPHGASFTNIIFCHNNVRILVFAPDSRNNDGYWDFLSRHFSPNVAFIYGQDSTTGYIHSDYYVPLEEVIKATNAI